MSSQDDRLRLARLALGFSQGDLARRAGVTRQAISGIESGRWSPSLEVALTLSRVLGVSVDDLFGAEKEPAPVEFGLVTPPRHSGVSTRLAVAEVAGTTLGFPLDAGHSFTPGFLPASAEYLAAEVPAARATEATTFSARRLADPLPSLVIAGCDPALSLLAGPLARSRPALQLVWRCCGSKRARELLSAGKVHVAGVHRDVGEPVAVSEHTEVVGFASWWEGLAVSPRHVGEVKDLRDVARLGLRLANREPGSEARRLLDRELGRLRIRPQEIEGYETAHPAHLLAAAAVDAGAADVAVVTEPSALAFGLEFHAWREETSELHISKDLMGSLGVRTLLRVLGRGEIARQLRSLEGYDPAVCGKLFTPG